MLEAIVLPPPLGSLVSVLLVAGLDGVARRLCAKERNAVQHTTWLLLVVFVLSSTIGVPALLPGSLPWWPRVVGIALGLFGCVSLVAAARDLRHRPTAAPAARSTAERATDVLVFIVIAGGLLVALAPPTDADSLDYHLGAPLDWLANGSIGPREDWLHARLVGAGEHIILLGLSCGADNLWAVLQAWVFARVTRAVAEEAGMGCRSLASLWFVATPVILSLLPSQKPQLLPALATTVAVLHLLRASWSVGASWRVALLVTGAVACKASFVLTGAPVLVWASIRAAREKQWTAWAFALGGAFVVFAPLWARQAWFYDDPIPPMLERFRSEPRAEVIAFADYLRSYGGEHDLATLLRQLWDLVVPSTLSALSLVLGVGLWAMAFTPGAARWVVLWALVDVAVFGQLGARFFVEPMWWAGLALTRRPRGRLLTLLWVPLFGQGLAVVVGLALGVVMLAPGSLTPASRARVMAARAPGYTMGRSIDERAPSDAMLIAETRFNAFLPRPFTAFDGVAVLRQFSTAARARLAASGRPLLLVEPEGGGTLRPLLGGCPMTQMGEPFSSPLVFRNPLRPPEPQPMVMTLIDATPPGCAILGWAAPSARR